MLSKHFAERFRLRAERLFATASTTSMMAAGLLESEGIRSLLYLDNDLCFFGDFEFLFQELQEHSLLLTPHWRPIDPDANAEQFFYNFRDGLYNAGFVGANNKGLVAQGLPALLRIRLSKGLFCGSTLS